ncbi:hypothetical protein ACVCII_24225 [Burkholderia glumae]|uniref:hypothetical protein n=1 Tax=Burkholderia glumae TaxID=337 RepID=UPI0020372482|nr:hypothetical protein [Burkholderia glumae]MCM2543866.1 hypothetical protein [Burkholderia glumae]
MNWLKRIWNDPVGSKLIAGGIGAAATALAARIGLIFDILPPSISLSQRVLLAIIAGAAIVGSAISFFVLRWQPGRLVSHPEVGGQTDSVDEVEDIRGQEFVGLRMQLDGKRFTRCTFKACILVYEGGKGGFMHCNFDSRCNFMFEGRAGATLGFLRGMYHGTGGSGREAVLHAISQPQNSD